MSQQRGKSSVVGKEKGSRRQRGGYGRVGGYGGDSNDTNMKITEILRGLPYCKETTLEEAVHWELDYDRKDD